MSMCYSDLQLLKQETCNRNRMMKFYNLSHRKALRLAVSLGLLRGLGF